YEVSGITKRCPENSHIKFEAIMSVSSLYSTNGPDYWHRWDNNNLHTYIRKEPSTSIASVDEKLVELVKKNFGIVLEKAFGVNFDQFVEQGGAYGYTLYPMTDTHLYSDLDNDLEPNSDIAYVYIFSSVGLFILVIACINFMNLATAKSSSRAREIGLRKTLGSLRRQMIVQFLTESLVYSSLAMGFSLIATFLLLPSFNLLSGIQLSMWPLLQPGYIGLIILLILVVGLLAGSYPAFYLTGFDIVKVLKGKVSSGMKRGSIRGGLVVFQFGISIALIICTGVVYMQLQYLENKNLGFDKEHILVINHTGRLDNDRSAFKNNLSQLPDVLSASYSNNVFPGVNNTTLFRTFAEEQDYIMGLYWADYQQQETMGFELVEGRYFSEDYPSDSTAIVINEAAVAHFGWKSAVGQYLLYNFDENGGEKLKVIGVVKDFNFETLRDKVRPISIRLAKLNDNLLVRYSGSTEKVISNLEATWKKYAAGEPFEYTFMDERYDELFRSEQRLGKLFTVLSGVAIFVACMGLFGLAAFMVEQRTKEIGIRKAMGASVPGLTTLLSKEFIILLVVAFILAVVPSWYVMESFWLNGFAFRISIEWWLFALAGIISFSVAWVTVAWQAYKAACANPVNSLRYE
ncbi:MAG: FtsX-like permease family protein, partial [Cyclobacteriaceae bacterium]|nr:FtsX-like permease family protein [Cyclobacteriaceae bacterium]